MQIIDKDQRVEDITHSVRDHTRAIRGFKHDMYMRYNNTSNQDKKNRILEKIENIYQVMTAIYENYKIECMMSGKESKQLEDLLNAMTEFYEEILTLRY